MLEKKLNIYVEEAYELYGLAGLAIGITVGEKSPLNVSRLNYKTAVGFKNFMTRKPLEQDNIFHVASVTKLFVGTGILLLEERGLLDIETPVVEFLPWMYIDDKRYKTLTLRQVLTHTAGLIDVADYGWDKPERDRDALKRYIMSEEVTKSKLLWDPTENRFMYSNMGYEILGAVIAEVAGISFEDFIMENIFKPLDMKNSKLLTYERAEGSLELEVLEAANLAMPHVRDDAGHMKLEPQYPYNRAHGPSSTLTTSIEDLGKWARANIEKRVLKEETYKKMWKEYALVPNNGEHIGLSWFIREQNGYTLYGHEGDDEGFRAGLWICPELDLHIAVTSNTSLAPTKKIGKNLFNIMTLV